MFAIQIHSLEPLSGDDESQNELDVNNIFLDVSSEGQRPRRYFMGAYTKLKRTYESLIHYTNGPVTLNLNCGPFRYHQMGVCTLYRYLQETPSNSRECVVLGQRGSSPVFQLCYSVREVTCMYDFAINEVTCLKQVSSSWRQDQLVAEVEYNHCPHGIDRGARNKYKLGRFSSNDLGSIHSVHNVTFSALSNFVITFFVKTLASEQLLAAVKFTPAPEVIENVERKKVEIKLRPHEYDGEHVAQFFDPSLVTPNDSSSGGLLVVRIDGRDTSSEFALAGSEVTSTQRISLVGASGGAYEIIYTIKKRFGAVTEQISSPTALWPNLRQIERQNLGFVMPQTKNFTAMPETVETDPDVGDFSPRLTELLLEGGCDISQRDFSQPTSANHVEILIDGLDTFRRYYEILMLAEHSISILGWEINFSFGLVLANEAAQPLPAHYDPANGKWITLEDVLVSKAKEGVKVRMIVWRHELLSYINRYLYLGEVTIEAEVAKLEKRCKKIGLTIKVIHSSGSNNMSPTPEADIVVVIAGNPKGLISTHHEKLVLVDHECPRHTVAFTGGFDIARGRFDQQAHLVPLPYNPMDIKNITGVLSGKADQIRKKEREIAPGLVREKRYTGRRIQPMFPAIRLLWHDIQLLLHGPVTRLLHLHFEHRWIYAFTQNPNSAKNLKVHVKPIPKADDDKCRKHRPLKLKGQHSNCSVRLERTWKGVIDTNFLFDDYCRLIRSAKRFLYFEHQYPFQNFALTYLMCDMLKKNPDLHVIIVTPVKTDLPTGLVGELFDWSQDHIIEHLNLIYSTAPDRVGVYGLVNQDPKHPDRIKPIYVHTKLTIVDDEWCLTGSTNMDNVSFFYSSELSIEIRNAQLTRDLRTRLFKEHLGSFYNPTLDTDLKACFDTFRKLASLNEKSLRNNGLIIGRPVFLAPLEKYNFVLSQVYYPNKLVKLMVKLGINPDELYGVASDAVDNVVSFLRGKSKL